MKRVAMPAGVMVAALAIGGTAAQAQQVNKLWDPQDIRQQILLGCKIDGAMFSIEKDLDGRARVEESPTLEPEKAECADKVISNNAITPRGESPSGME